MEIQLTECYADETLEVVDLPRETPLAGRLAELGVVPGRCVRVVRTGSPMILEMDQARFCLRAEEAAAVRVRLAFPAFDPAAQTQLA